MNKLNINKFIKDMIRFIIILVAIDLVWQGLEILFDSGVTNTVSDSVIGLVLSYLINKDINDYKAHKLFMYELNELNSEMRQLVEMEDENE